MKLRTNFHMWVAAVVAAALAMIGLTTASLPAIATETATTAQVCSDLVSGDGWQEKKDTTGDPKTVDVVAPEGKLIDKYCVKAGSVQNGNGPVVVDVEPPAKNVTISYPGGKAVSHYMVHYVIETGWDYQPRCESLTVTFPNSVVGNDVKVKFHDKNDNYVTELLWKADENTVDAGSDNWPTANGNYSGTVTFSFTGHPGWSNVPSEYIVAWVQIDGNNYHWEQKLQCGEPDPEPLYICEWDAEKDEASIVEVAEGGKPFDEVDKADCTPAEIQICVADGNGGFETVTVFDDEVGYTAVDPDNCVAKEYVCVWDADKNEPQQVLKTDENANAPEWANGSECTPGTIGICVADGEGYKVIEGIYDDGSLGYDPVDMELCNTPAPVDYCVFTPEGGATHETLPAGESPNPGAREYWTAWPTYGDDPETLPEGCVKTPTQECLNLGDGEFEIGEYWEGDDVEIADPAACTSVYYCSWDSEENMVTTLMLRGDENAPQGYFEWEGYPEANPPADCLPKAQGKTDLCHANESENGGGSGYVAINVSWSAVYNWATKTWGIDMVNDPNGHGSDNGQHVDDIIPPFTIGTGEYAYQYPGKNWEAFSGEGGQELWELFLKNGCATPVQPSAGGTHTDLTCLNPEFGGFDYEAVIGSFQSPITFRLVKLGEGSNELIGTYGPFMPEDEVDISEANLTPGDYRITGTSGEMFQASGFAQPALVEVNPYAMFTYEFTIDPPEEDCFDIDSSYVEALCSDGAPLINWMVDLNDPAAQLPNEATDLTEITITFSKEGFEPWSTTVAIDPADYPLWSGQIEWPGFGTDGEGNPNAWPGWDYIDGVLQNVGTDNYGWTRDGATVTVQLNPETEITGVTYPAASGDCEPPVIEVCEFGDEGAQMVTYYGEAPAGAIEWANGLECTPIQICSEADGEWSPLTIMESMFNSETDQLWVDGMFAGGCAEPAEPTLTGSFIGGTCVADAPWLSYNIVVNNPDDQPLDGVEEGEEPMATITFVNPDGEDYTLPGTYPLGEGRVLWPGAAVAPAEGYTEDQIDPTNGDTFVATDWPGWVQDEDGEWLPVDDPQDNFGWTRDGVQVLVQVNPETTVTVNYPPATPTCAANPPTTTTVVLGAPPLTSETPTTVADAPKPVAVRVASVTYTG